MRHAKWMLAVGLVGVVVAVAMAGDLDGVPDWMEPLATTDGAKRQLAIDTLAGDIDRFGDCLEAIEDDGYAPTLRASVASAVAGMRLSPTEVESAASLLRDSRAPVRMAGLRILGAHAKSARQALATTAANPEEVVALRTAAAAGLARAGSAALADLRALLAKDATPEAVRLAAIRALPQVSSEGLGSARAIAQDTKAPRREREAAIQALGAAGETGVTPLLAVLSSPQSWVRAEVLVALTATGSSTATSTFATSLNDPAALVRLNALQGLAARGALPTHAAAVAARMNDTDPRVQVLAIQDVGLLYTANPTAVVPGLKTLLGATTFAVRHQAAITLFVLRDKSGLATMQADALSPNASQAAMAARVVQLIQNATW